MDRTWLPKEPAEWWFCRNIRPDRTTDRDLTGTRQDGNPQAVGRALSSAGIERHTSINVHDRRVRVDTDLVELPHIDHDRWRCWLSP